MAAVLAVAASLGAHGAAAQEPPPVPADLGEPASAGPGVVGDEIDPILEAVRERPDQAEILDRDPDRPSLTDQVTDDAAACRDAVRTAIRWNYSHDVRRDCAERPLSTLRTTTWEVREHSEDCRAATAGTWWEVGRDVRRECLRQPVATVEDWVGVDVPYAGWRGGLVL